MMKKHRNYIALTAILQLFIYAAGSAQQENEKHKIIITLQDSVIKTSVLDTPLKGKTDNSTDYYWYYAGKINHNQGGYSGKLIHGKYEVFDNQQMLLTRGNFLFGVKNGDWIRWYQNGKIRESCSFKKGRLDGALQTFDSSGHLLANMNFKSDLLDGESRYYLKDTVITKKYRMGKELIVDKHRKLFPWIKRHEPDKKDLKDKTQRNTNT